MNAPSSSVEPIDDDLRKCCELAQKCAGRIAWGKASLADRYLWGDIELALCFSREKQSIGLVIRVSPLFIEDNLRILTPPADILYRRLRSDLKESCVLSDQVKIMESKEKAVPSLVRLEVFDFCNIGILDSLYLFPRSLALEVPGAPGYREMYMGHGFYAVPASECHGQHVERTPQCVDNDAEVNVHEAWRGLDRDLDQLQSALRVGIFGKRIGIAIEPSVNLSVKEVYLGIGPVDYGLSV